MLPALIVVYMTPLNVQRPTALLMFLGALAWGEYVCSSPLPLPLPPARFAPPRPFAFSLLWGMLECFRVWVVTGL